MSSIAPGIRRLLLVVALLVGGVSTAAAQSTVSLRGNVGASFFQSPGAEQELLNSGTDLGLGIDVAVYRGVSVVLEGGYDQFTLNQENARARIRGPLQAGNISLLSGSIGLKYTLRTDGDVKPYFLTGAGLYRGEQTASQVYEEGVKIGPAESKTSVDKGFYLAVGSNLRLDETYAVFIEPRFTFVNAKPDGFLISPSETETPRYFTLRLGLDVRLW